ncbi:hypothetical protein PsYK624_028090 [Phanerochaete sordida]|uniref:Uncharacterized protein n=1 Tax=Phanerochaete sordida TaxID=48140 RepID=A0A9P3LA79_9APHY|nr:hypothetical protein PsYK624_028090 [Phanerochaete sordida]
MYSIGTRESAHAYAVGSNEAYETIRTLPESHAPQPWRVRRTVEGTYVLTYCEKPAASISDAAVALVLQDEQSTEWIITAYGEKDLYIIQDRETQRVWHALDRGMKDIISLAYIDTRRPPPRALFEFRRVNF